MDDNKKSARAAHIFGRWMEIRARHDKQRGNGSGCFCSLVGGATLYYHLRDHFRKEEMLEQLRAVEKHLKTELYYDESRPDPKIDEPLQLLRERVTAWRYESLGGFWVSVLGMIREEGGDPDSFMEFCRGQYRAGMIRSECQNDTYGVEGWLYLNLVQYVG